METFFNPQSIVIFGASKDPQKSGNRVLRNILNYTNKNVYLIHPKEEEILGIQCYRDLTNIPLEHIDLGVIILPIPYVLDALERCVEFHVKSIIIESGALYFESDDDFENENRVQMILDNANKTGIRIMGPNSIGIYCAKKGTKNLTTSLIYSEDLPGMKEKNLSIVAQTGLTLSGLLLGQNYIQEVGLAKIACIGNKIDINESDLLDFLENDPDTNAIALYLEDIKEGQRFKKQCERISKKKPLILLKSGKTEKGKKAIVSHTKSLAGNYKIIEGLCKQFGIILVEDFHEMFMVSKCLLNQPIPKGNKIGVVSISGAGTVLASDLSDKFNLKLIELNRIQKQELKEIFPKFAWKDIYNPLDIWASIEKVGPNKAYQKSGNILLSEKNVDILIFYITGIKESEFDWSILKNLNETYPCTAIYVGFFGGDKKLLLKWREEIEERLNIPTFESITMMFKTISKLLELKTTNGSFS
ncbi:MAG: CoA-binding protein [Desulfotignum sp.]